MSFLFATPEALAAAASDLSGIGSTINSAGAAAAAPTSAVAASAADAVSAQVAAFLSQHGLGYQQFSAQIAQFHEQFVQTLSSGANAFAAAESNAAQTLADAANAPAAALPGAAQTLASAVNAPAATLLGGAVSGAVNRVESVVAGANFLGGAAVLGGGGGGGGIAATVGGAVSSAVTSVESVVGVPNFLGSAGLLGSNFLGLPQALASQAGALLPTGGIRALTAASALVTPATMTNAAVVPAASGSIGDAIKAGYLLVEPYVQYGFDLAAYAVGYLPYVGWLAPQIYFLYDMFEPMVQAGLFNTIDWLQGSISFAQGLANFWDATTASINQFISTEIYWALSFLPPLPPLPPFFP
jgi:PE family